MINLSRDNYDHKDTTNILFNAGHLNDPLVDCPFRNKPVDGYLASLS